MSEKFKVRVLRAFWPEDDIRVNEGEVIEVEAGQALSLVKEGIVEPVENAKPKISTKGRA